MPTPHDDRSQIGQRGQQALMRGDLQAALGIYQDAVKRHPAWAEAHLGLGSVQMLLLQYDRAKEHLEKAVRLEPASTRAQVRLAELLSRMGLAESALEHVDRALKSEPRNVHAMLVRADALRIAGDLEAALDAIEPAADTGHPAAVTRWCMLAGRAGRRDEAITRLESAQPRSLEHPELRAEALFQLALLYEQAGRFDEAFESVRLASEHRAGTFDIARERRLQQEWVELWSKDRMTGLARSRSKSEAPVFVVGMPRSGTSLVEQIIASHPQGAGAGEMTTIGAAIAELVEPTEAEPSRRTRLDSIKPAALDRVGRRVLREMARVAGAPKAARISDKMPQNFLNIGFIEQLFPGARIVHCRRDPLDTCISCYFLDFGGRHNASFTYDLQQLGEYYRGYEQMMDHWRASSGLAMLELDYEQLVHDQETQSKRLIEFLGLEWDDACLSPHKTRRTVTTLSTDQVRRPVYTSSIGRWRNYERQLAPLQAALGLSGHG